MTLRDFIIAEQIRLLKIAEKKTTFSFICLRNTRRPLGKQIFLPRVKTRRTESCEMIQLNNTHTSRIDNLSLGTDIIRRVLYRTAGSFAFGTFRFWMSLLRKLDFTTLSSNLVIPAGLPQKVEEGWGRFANKKSNFTSSRNVIYTRWNLSENAGGQGEIAEKVWDLEGDPNTGDLQHTTERDEIRKPHTNVARGRCRGMGFYARPKSMHTGG